MRNLSKPFMAELQKARRTGNPYQAVVDDATALAPALASLPSGPVAVDNSDVIRAIGDLGAKLDRFLTMDAQQIDQIQVEIADISGRIKATKVEMAAIRHPLAGDDKFVQASQELNAVVSATEAATNTIMACAEELEEVVHELKSSLPEGYHADRVNDMNDVIVRIYEACNFQDLTGQRITKVVRALSFIEERVDAMMSHWNKREFEAMPLPPTVTKMDETLELHGPADHQEMGNISQADIDALFG
ncbi:protein phosphatase CheZ [Azospirillum sp. YIM DDC1]|uniref:Protein phosphatase CheZ n=1 Tax=Azospirillum aestuarii TaxID=2802052 RepID=A0ABS1HV88_9PROT|nr:protein phosphatase CheZ [Azospirillum aestuarii]MBK4718337.1 protein phosphatase CheZ [Azospirillum aestuarii]TWA94955.1 chemotaxis protein CheZ [Azospirillum brasilense]